jgi:4-hydroxybenzoate polyprenyltransferase
MPLPEPSLLRTLLVLGRVSNLPTVWSNCLAGWLLGGGGSGETLIQLTIGASFLYLGGMFLNDAFDVRFDRQFRRNRPIPSGHISEHAVWQFGFGFLGGGATMLILIGPIAAGLALGLVAAILLYDAVHKAVSFSPLLMAACRFLLFLLAAASGKDGIGGLAIWTAVALTGWIVGLSYVARRESLNSPLSAWPLTCLALPVVLSLLVNSGENRIPALFLAALLCAWAAWCVHQTFGAPMRNIGRTVSGLLAGICLVDLLGVSPSPALAAVFVALFLIALVAQRFVPAT